MLIFCVGEGKGWMEEGREEMGEEIIMVIVKATIIIINIHIIIIVAGEREEG